MRRMLLLGVHSAVVITAALLIESVQAHDHRGGNAGHQPGEKSFTEIKAAKLRRIERVRNCVAKATTFGEMKACRPKQKPGAKP